MDPIPVFFCTEKRYPSLEKSVSVSFCFGKLFFLRFALFCFDSDPFLPVAFPLGREKILDLIRNGDFRFDSFLCFLRFSRLRSHWPLSENGRPSDWRKNEFEERNIGYESSLKKFLRSD